MNHQHNCRLGQLPAVALALVLATLLTAPAYAQRGMMAPMRGMPARAMIIPGMPFGGIATGAQEDSSVPVSIDVDPEVERLLHRADQYVQDGRYDLAAVLAQRVLDAPSSLMLASSADGYKWYSSTHQTVEQLLAKLPKEALAAYRLTADAEAKGLLAAAGAEREVALAAVVRRFFVSSIGDDAAFELGCRLMDRYDFVGASRMFNRILVEHPDASIPRDQLLLRQAVASAHLGDAKGARAYLKQLTSSSLSASTRSVLEQVVESVESTRSPEFAATSSSSSWPTQLGSFARDGVMPALADPVLARPLVADTTWGSKVFALPAAPNSNSSPYAASLQLPSSGTSRETLVARWSEQAQTPVSQVLLQDGRLYIKSYTPYTQEEAAVSSRAESLPVAERATEELVSAFDAKSGQLAFRTRPTPMRMNFRLNMNHGGLLAATQFDETLLFQDRTNHLFSVIDGVLYVVEGTPAGAGDNTEQMNFARQGIIALGNSKNRLSAFWDPSHPDEPSEGKIRWTDEGNPWMTEVQFVSAPVPCRDRIAIAGREGGGLYLYIVATDDGSLEQKVFLCSEPRGGTSAVAAVGLAVDGDELYVASGYGLVFAIDAAAASVRWAVQYPRPVATSFGPNVHARRVAEPVRVGFDEDIVIPRGRVLIVMPSDSDQIYAFDRRSGAEEWKSPIVTPDGGTARYCLGVMGDSLFVAGPDVVRRIKVLGGSIVWERTLEGEKSLGRGILTPGAIYLPVEDSILQLDPHTKAQLARVIVTLPDHDPVGNLLSDGHRLYAFGLDRFHPLMYKPVVPVEPTPIEQPMETPLEESAEVEAEPAQAVSLVGDLQPDESGLRAATGAR